MQQCLFFDSSALVKRYLKEQGSLWVLHETDPAESNLILISSLTQVEMVATFQRQGKQGGTITSAEAARAIRDFQFDLTHQYYVIDLLPSLINAAMQLAVGYALRGADAVQLAAGIEANRQVLSRGLPPITFVSSDLELSSAATGEQLSVENAEAHP